MARKKTKAGMLYKGGGRGKGGIEESAARRKVARAVKGDTREIMLQPRQGIQPNGRTQAGRHGLGNAGAWGSSGWQLAG